jgi:hypothetical protein
MAVPTHTQKGLTMQDAVTEALAEPYSVRVVRRRGRVHGERYGWEAVVAYHGDEPIGYVFAVPLGENTGWWNAEQEPLPAEYVQEDGKRTLALNEILVRKPWRGAHGTGAARSLHEELLSQRQEHRVTLLVNPALSDGRLKAVYESWDYKQIGSQQSFDDSPVFATMMRDPLHQ